MLPAALRTMPGGSRFKGDCKSCIGMLHTRMTEATSAKRVLARVYGMLLTALEGVSLDRILWMPAHNSAAHVGKLQLSNGEVLTKEDVFGNDEADKGASEGVEEHQAPAMVVEEL